MKLTEQQIAAIQAATGLKPIPEDSAAQREFTPHFGDHTFYPDRNGMFIFEPGAAKESGETDKAHGVQIAEWIERDGTKMVGVVEPTPINLVVDIPEA